MAVYYNEFDPKAAATLRELIHEGLIAPGDVDERSIEDVLPRELSGYTQVHLFAGFGIWSLAFRMAGWSDYRSVWSASCPCQPFSAAGKGGGFSDERHLWPAAFWLAQNAKRPEVPFYGEQVASPDGLAWLDLVQADLEGIGHTMRYCVLASAGFGAPIIRQRTYWMASTNREQHDGRGDSGTCGRSELADRRAVSGVERTDNQRLEGRSRAEEREDQLTVGPGSLASGMAVTNGGNASTKGLQRSGKYGLIAQDSGISNSDRGTGPTNGFWRDADWLRCRDDKWRPVEPGTFPLANGYPERVGLLRGAGNAISPQVAAAWIEVTK